MSASPAKHVLGTDTSESQSSKTKSCNAVPANPWLPAAAATPSPKLLPIVTGNAHLLPLIKGIIIYNFLLKNQLCILSIAGGNSQLVTWLEKIDQNSSLWKEKKAVLKLFIYRHKRPCCRTFSNYEDFLQCIKIKDFLKIIALGF